MERFRRLAIASTVATLLLVAIGGLVRATKSGLGCGTDWPHCSGKLLPALESRAVAIEFSHRAAAGIVVALLVLLAWTARRQRVRKELRFAAFLALALVVLQALLGAVVVKLELEAASVVLHLATAMALVATLVYLSLATTQTQDSRVDDGGNAKGLRTRASVAAGSVLVLLMVGSYVGGTPGAGLAFGDWPLMNGSLAPTISGQPELLHFVHRLLAALVGVIVAVVCLEVMRHRDRLPRQARFAELALGLFVVQVVVGAINVWTSLNPVAVTAHLAVGALIWAALVGLVVTLRLPVTATATRERLRSVEPALGPGR